MGFKKETDIYLTNYSLEPQVGQGPAATGSSSSIASVTSRRGFHMSVSPHDNEKSVKTVIFGPNIDRSPVVNSRREDATRRKALAIMRKCGNEQIFGPNTGQSPSLMVGKRTLNAGPQSNEKSIKTNLFLVSKQAGLPPS